MDRPTKDEVLLDLFLTSVKEIITEVKTLGPMPLSKFVISRNMGLAKSRVRTLNFRRANFCLLKELLDEISRWNPWKLSHRTKEHNQAGISLRTTFCEHESSPSSRIRNQGKEEARNRYG